MKIISREEAINKYKEEEHNNVFYYLRDEYELHYTELEGNSIESTHHHEKVFETVFIINGQLTLEWLENDQIKSRIVKEGDFIETGTDPHRFINHTDATVKKITIKQVLSGKNNKDIFKNDKFIDIF